MQVIYSRTNHDAGAGEPGEKRLTYRVPRPYESALSIVAAVVRIDPEAARPALDGLRERVRSPVDGCRLPDILAVLTRVARSDPTAVDPLRDRLERIATDDQRGTSGGDRRARIAARNLLRELGVALDRPAPVPTPALVARETPPSEAVRTAVMDEPIDERAIAGDVDVDFVLEALRSSDAEVRDYAAWGLECGIAGLTDPVHERATSFLALANEPDECASKHLRHALGVVAASYPEQWTPAAAELATHPDPNARGTALSILGSVADSSPALVFEHLSLVRSRLSDEADDVRAKAATTLAVLADGYPDSVSKSIPDLVALIDEGRPLSAVRCLDSLARADPGLARSAFDPVYHLVEDLAGPEAIDDRARYGRARSVEVATGDLTLAAALSFCLALARSTPDAVASVRPHAERIVDGRYYGWKTATNLLAALDG